MRFLLKPTVAILSLALAAFLFVPSAALAHERRDVGAKYQFVVGFLDEPPIQGFKNGIDLRVMTKDGDKPVEGLEKTLKAKVFQGSASQEIKLEPRFRQPGAYNGYFIPTKAGTYKFVFTGTIEGIEVNETFESGPGRFNDVQSAAEMQFPDRIADTAGLAPAVTQASNTARTAVDIANEAQAAANTARWFGIAGIIAGVLGLVVGGTLATRRR